MQTDESAESDSTGGPTASTPGAAAVQSIDDGLVELLSWLLDTETRARIYIYLRMAPARTSGEVADGTGLYPSTVRECLAAMHGDGLVSREKRASKGAGNNPYEYVAIPPGELLGNLVTDIQRQLNAVCNLDHQLKDQGQGTDGSMIRVEIEENPGE